ncbi:MAG TPA: sensor histidine kinase [Clostridiales bacterium]|nr:sensor histidine kinase [Clostridiales bacterium]
MKLKNKFFITLFLISVIPLIILTIFAYERYKATTFQQMNDVASNIFTKAADKANDTIYKVEQVAGIFTFYSDGEYSIIENLKNYSSPKSSHTSYEIYKTNQNIKFICENILYTYDFIYGLYVITPAGVNIGYNTGMNGDLVYGYNPEGAKWLEETSVLNGKLYISSIAEHNMFTGKRESLFFAKSLYDVYTHEFLGTLIIDCNPAMFDLSPVNTLPSITLLSIENKNNNQILYTNINQLKSNFTEKNKKIFKTGLDLDQLSLSAVFNYDELYKAYNLTEVLLLIIAVFCMAGTIVLSIIFSNSLTKPITHLSDKMASQHGSHLTLTGRYLNRNDEIGVLYNEYNSMVDELNISIKRDYQNKLITLDSQMKSLEAWINSHFLFNTLESINSIAFIEGNERIATMAMSLGNMFRYAIKTKSEMVTVQDELNHVRDYVSIQKIRFSDNFDLNIRIPEAIRSQHVLKLILQPLVENALFHGLQYCHVGSRIDITARLDQKHLYIEVTDDGKGMNPLQLKELQDKLRQEATFTELGHRDKQSIGLKNIHTRIELYYGKGYGLFVRSTEGAGTTVEIKLPVLEGGR